MKRKVVQHGPSTLIISLPSKWVDSHHIKKGDELEVEEAGSSVIISTPNEKRLGEIVVDVTGLDRSSLMYLIRSLYKLGYNEIRLTFKEQSTVHYRLANERTILSVIHEELNRLIGIEVIQQRENSCTLKVLSEMNFSEFEPMLRRIFLMLIDASSDLMKGAEKNDKALLQTLEEKHNTITKFISFCIRLLNTKGYASHNKTTVLYHIVTILDKSLDILKNTGRLMLDLNVTISPETKRIMKNIHQSLIDYYDLFYKFDNNKVLKISHMRDTIFKDIKTEHNSISKKEIIVLTSMSVILELINDATESRLSLEY